MKCNAPTAVFKMNTKKLNIETMQIKLLHEYCIMSH